jgi:hypothetical protein
MQQRKRYGAMSFVSDDSGGFSMVAAMPANYALGAIGAAAKLRTTLSEQMTPRIGAVAFEWIPGRTPADRAVCLFRTGDVPNDEAIRAALAQMIEAPANAGPVGTKPRAKSENKAGSKSGNKLANKSASRTPRNPHAARGPARPV